MGLTRRLAQPLLAASFVAGGVETLLDPGPRIARAREAGLDELPFGDAATLTRANAAVQVAAGAMLAKAAPERFAVATHDDDRVRVGVRFNPEALPDLRLEKRIQCVLPLSERIDCSSHRAFLSSWTSSET